MVICGASNNEAGVLSPNLSLSQPVQSFRHSNNMHANLDKLTEHYKNQVNLVNHHTGGQSGGFQTCQSDQSQDYTTMKVPQFNVFNPAGPDGPNGGSQNNNLTLYTNRQNGWQDKWAFVSPDKYMKDTMNPPPVISGGRRKTKLSKNKKKKSKKYREKKTKKTKTNKRNTNKRKTNKRKTKKRLKKR